MRTSKTKFQLGDHVSYSNKRHKYSYTGQIIAREGRYCIVEISSSEGNVLYKGRKDIVDGDLHISERFNTPNIWGGRSTISSDCVWDSSQFLHHTMKPYEEGQNGDTDDDV